MTNRRYAKILGASFLLLMGTVSGASAGPCLSADIDAPVILPDGSVHTTGTLRVCDSRTYSPVASLHATFIDGVAVGLLRSRRFQSEAGTDSPQFVFDRSEGGRLRLLGYVIPAGDGRTSVTYRLAPPTFASEAPYAVAQDSSGAADGRRERGDAVSTARSLAPGTATDDVAAVEVPPATRPQAEQAETGR